MKRLIYIALLLFTVHCSLLTATAQSRTNRLTRPCPGSTTPATVSISVAGNITLTPCSGGTVTVNGVKVYRALLTQSGTSAPTVTVLENTLGGTVVWTRNGAGEYYGTLANAFPASKLVMRVFRSNYTPAFFGDEYFFDLVRISSNVIAIQAYEGGILADSILSEGNDFDGVEILVYP